MTAMANEPASDPELLVAVVGITTALVIIFIRWILELARNRPADPWPAGVDQAVRQRGAVPVCTDCLSPQVGHRWFCPHCGFPTGEYVTTMPYLYIFAQGELLRRGVTGPPDRGRCRPIAFALAALTQFSLFAPVYWFWMVRKARGKPICQVRRVDLPLAEIDPPASDLPDEDPRQS